MYLPPPSLRFSALPPTVTPQPRVSQPQAPQFSGKHADSEIKKVLDRTYKVKQTVLHYGSKPENEMDGWTILDRLYEACRERPVNNRTGATSIASMILSPSMLRHDPSVEAFKRGLRDLSTVGLVREIRDGEYIITPKGLSIVMPEDDD